MAQKDFERITFTSHNASFESFYNSMKDVLIELSTEKNLFTCNKILATFIGSYRYGVVNTDRGDEIDETLVKITDDLINDQEIQKMIKYDQQNIDIALQYTKRYYYYFERMVKLLGIFLESLNQTLMPNTYSGGKKLRYSYNIPFFNRYAEIKKVISENLTSFNIDKFIKPINSIIVFYYGYRSFVTTEAREDIERVIERIIGIVSEQGFLKVITKEQRSTREQQELNIIKNKMYSIILKIYSKMNEEHSIYDLNPQIVKKVYVDSTGI